MQHGDKDLSVGYDQDTSHCDAKPSSSLRQRGYFTLIELLVVVVVIAILMALLLPVLAKAKYRARHVLCASNQKQITTSMLSYAGDNDMYYPVPKRYIWTAENSFPIPPMIASWTINNSYAHNSWATYVGGTTGNYKDLTVQTNGVAVCPQGVTEVLWKLDDSKTNTFSGVKALYNYFIYSKMKGTVGERRKYTKRRVGKVLTAEPGVSFSDAPLMSDHCQGVEATHSQTARGIYNGRAFSTNHVFGGDRYRPWTANGIHYATAPVYWGTISGKGEANYGMEDGSVRQFKGLSWYNKSSRAYSWPSLSVCVNDTPLIPLELKD